MARRRDLPLERDGTGRFLPWLIALMVYLACLALAGAIMLDEASGRWQSGLTGTMTAQIPAADSGKSDEHPATIAAVLDVLKNTPGIRDAQPLTTDSVIALIEPWLGKGNVASDLPIPVLIDIQLEENATFDTVALAIQLEQVAPGTRLDDHEIWITRMLRLSQTIGAVAMTIVILIGIAAAATVVFATRTGLAVHQGAIEVLHIIGARDTYIARQFQVRAMSLALRGGLLGLILATMTLALLAGIAGNLEGPLLPQLAVTPSLWGGLAALPLAAALIATLTARITVVRTLSRLP
ncbi:MAG: cell division protein [Alphaproteobacteria bacterium]|jgi:cell division transport system permease protein|nr:cell division protein [Alphaproteobacteria bacterium]MBT4083446.1 cell division protein [Alphaproteobacteria bacterium]MBT4542902.1 cell division protein [Alphaproteobacteria bacterium]MBT5919521.1 cell division protein [Alphaproteobacteria bacterium]MBT6384669.1 cell division protein [Alphaproteobacteria bacterium]